MNVTTWVDVAIGLTVVYLGVSLFVTIINEYIAQVANLRGSQLRKSLEELVQDEALRKKLVKSPALKAFFPGGAGKPPSYVDPNVFARLLVGSLNVASTAGTTMRDVASSIDALADSPLKTQLQALVRTSEDKIDKLLAAVSDWVDRSLTVLGEGYKRRLQWISLGIGLVVAGVLNVDTVALTTHLYRDKEAREATVALAVEVAERTQGDSLAKCLAMTSQERQAQATCARFVGLVDAVRGRNASLGKIPIGWAKGPDQAPRPGAGFWDDVTLWAKRLLGWALTGLAVSLGAPFWFDLLNKLVNVRFGMRKPEATRT